LEKGERNSLKTNNERESCRLGHFSVKKLVVLGFNEFYLMNGFDCVCFDSSVFGIAVVVVVVVSKQLFYKKYF
jgi:hypothetical protein